MVARAHNAGILILCFLTGGQVQLEENGAVIWHSDDDADFRAAIPDEFLDEEDADKILEYLVEEGILEDEEAEGCEIEVESLDGDEDEDDEE